MVTIVRRSAVMGDARLPRMPFAEPGIQPSRRVSVLSHGNGDFSTVATTPDLATGTVIGQGTGDAPVYRINSDGQPWFDFDQNPAAAGNGPTFHIAGGAAPKTQIVIGRFLRQPDAAQGIGHTTNAIMLRASYSSEVSLGVLSTTDANSPGCIYAYGAGSGLARGPVVSLNGIHFFAATYNGAGSILQLDGEQITANITANTTNSAFLVGNQKTPNSRFQIIEAMQYTEALTAAQLNEKRAHYRALYQF